MKRMVKACADELPKIDMRSGADLPVARLGQGSGTHGADGINPQTYGAASFEKEASHGL